VRRAAATLLLLGAGHRLLSIDISCPRRAQQQMRRTLLQQWIDGTYKQTDRQTDTVLFRRPCCACNACLLTVTCDVASGEVEGLEAGVGAQRRRDDERVVTEQVGQRRDGPVDDVYERCLRRHHLNATTTSTGNVWLAASGRSG